MTPKDPEKTRMPRRKLTDKLVQAIQPPKSGRLTFTDLLEPGLDLRVTETDARSWSVRCWTGPADKRVQRGRSKSL